MPPVIRSSRSPFNALVTTAGPRLLAVIVLLGAEVAALQYLLEHTSLAENRLELAFGTAILGSAIAVLALSWALEPLVKRLISAEQEAGAARHQLKEAENRISSITDNVPVRNAYSQADGVLTFASRAFAEFADKPLESIVGQTYRDVLGDYYCQRAVPFFKKGLEGESSHYERRVTKDGRDEVHDVSFQPDIGTDGKVRGLYGMSYDITALKHAERYLIASEKHFRSITDNLPAIVAYVDNDERYRSMNAGVSRLGLQPKDFIGNKMSEMLSPSNYKSIEPYVLRVLAGEKCRSEGEMLILGQHYFHRTEFVPDRAGNGSVRGFFVMALDVTEQRSVELELRQSEETLRLLIEGVFDYSIILLDPHGYVASWNAGANRIKGYCADEIIGHHFSEFYLPDATANGVPARLLELARESGSAQDEGWQLRQHGERYWAVISIAALRDDNGGLRGFSHIVRDRTETRAAESALKARELQLRTITDHVPVFICYIDREHVFRFNNAEYARRLRRPIEEITNRPVREVYGDNVYFQLVNALEQALAGETTKFEASYPGWDGTLRISRGTYVPDFSESGDVVGVHGLVRDVTHFKRAEKDLIQAAETDVLTGLPNRKKITTCIRTVLETSFDKDPFAALMFLDMDHFKRINDEHGHETGDEVLRQFGQRVREALRPTDVVARLGGDEFVVLLSALHGPTESQLAARNILAAMSTPLKLTSRNLVISASIGIAQRVEGEKEVSQWLKRADEALYQAKQRGRNAFESR